MQYDQTAFLSIRVMPGGGDPLVWAWAIYRYPDELLTLRSRAEYVDPHQAMEAGRIAAGEIGRRLDLAVVGAVTLSSSDAPEKR